jgi:hypothetical protein
MWLDTSGSDYSLKTWDGSAWREIVVTSAMIKDGAIVNADINASAAIAHTKLANITAGSVLLGNASNVPTATALSGDVTVSDAGVTAIGSGVIVDADINASAAIALSKLTTGALPSGITVGSSNLTSNSVNTAAITNGAVTVDKLSNGATGTGVGYVRDGLAASSAGQGYGYTIVQAPNGSRALIQWGFTTTTSTSAVTSAGFHTSFRSGFTPSVTCTVQGIVFGNTRVCVIDAVSNSGFSYQVRDQNNGAQGNGIKWIAIGEAP